MEIEINGNNWKWKILEMEIIGNGNKWKWK